MEKLKEKLRAFDWRMLLAAAVSLIVGLTIVIRPEASEQLLAYVLATVVTVFGLLRTLLFFREKKRVSPFSVNGLAPALTILSVGIFLLCDPAPLVAILRIVLGCLLIYLGFVSLHTTIDLVKARAKLWYVPLLFALALLVCGFLAFVNPFKSTRGLMIFLGIALLAECVMQIAALILLGKPAKTAAASEQTV